MHYHLIMVSDSPTPPALILWPINYKPVQKLRQEILFDVYSKNRKSVISAKTDELKYKKKNSINKKLTTLLGA